MDSNQSQGSALGKVIDDSLVKAKGGLSEELQKRQVFSDRVRVLNKRLRAVCAMPGAKGLVKPSDFDGVFNAVKTIWEREPLDFRGDEAAFAKVDEALDDAEERIATHLREQEEKRLAKLAFEQRRDEMAQRVDVLVKGAFAKASTFDAAQLTINQLHQAGTHTGEDVEKAFVALDGLLKIAEAQAEKTKLLTLELNAGKLRLATLAKSRFMQPGWADPPTKTLGQAETALGTPDFDLCVDRLGVAGKQLDRLAERIAAEQHIEDNRGDHITALCGGPLQSKDVSPEDIGDELSEDQINELIRMCIEWGKASKTQKPKVGRAIRDKYDEFVELNQPDDEDEEEATPPPVESEAQKRTRIHEAKLKRKSMATLQLIDKENEIHRTVLVFENRGADFKVGNTGKKSDYVPDYVSGYDVQIRNAPNVPPLNGRYYDRMIVHFHFSDPGYSQLQRAHFKNTHAGSDKSHVLIKSGEMAQALSICKKWL